MNPGSQQTQNTSGATSSTTAPWAVQQPYLTQGFSDANTALNSANANSTIPSQFTASYSPQELAQFTAMAGAGNNQSVPNSSAAAGGALSASGAAGAAQGIGALSGFTNSGGTQSNINNANAYVAGQNIPAQVQADMQGANQEANYVTNPGIDASAAGDGDINSSRAAIQHGLVATNLAQTAANTGAQLQANAYNTGLGLSEQNNESNNTNTLNAAAALTTGSGYDANAGTAANSGSVTQAGGLYGITGQGITGQQAVAQAPLTNAQQAFTANTTDPYSALNNYMALINGNYGSTSSGTTQGTQASTSTPSTLSQIGGYVNLAGSLI